MTKSCNFPTDSCKFPTENITAAQDLNFAPKLSQNRDFQCLILHFRPKNYLTNKI